MTRTPLKIVEAIAHTLTARENCRKDNREWFERHTETLRNIEKELPSGSGIDAGTTIDLDASTPAKIVLLTSFHHMSDGFYDGWTEHKITVRPSFVGRLEMTIGGRDRNDIKDYLGQVFDHVLLSDTPASVYARLED